MFNAKFAIINFAINVRVLHVELLDVTTTQSKIDINNMIIQVKIRLLAHQIDDKNICLSCELASFRLRRNIYFIMNPIESTLQNDASGNACVEPPLQCRRTDVSPAPSSALSSRQPRFRLRMKQVGPVHRGDVLSPHYTKSQLRSVLAWLMSRFAGRSGTQR